MKPPGKRFQGCYSHKETQDRFDRSHIASIASRRERLSTWAFISGQAQCSRIRTPPASTLSARRGRPSRLPTVSSAAPGTPAARPGPPPPEDVEVGQRRRPAAGGGCRALAGALCCDRRRVAGLLVEKGLGLFQVRIDVRVERVEEFVHARQRGTARAAPEWSGPSTCRRCPPRCGAGRTGRPLLPANAWGCI